MRPFLSFCLCLLATVYSIDAAETFPHYAYIANDTADVWSGPSLEYYVTGRVTQGTRVEVHRRDQGGWLAIRPPENSFSWVPANKILMTPDDRIGEVISDDAFAWIGSVVTAVDEHRWQVKLDRGERVEIVGDKRVGDEMTGVTTTWYRIAPPAGEFRWVRDLDVSSEAVDSTDTLDKPPRMAREASAADKDVQQALWAQRSPSTGRTARYPQADETTSRTTARTTGPSTAVPSAVGPISTPDNPRQLDAGSRETGSAEVNPAKSLDLSELEAELSLIVSKDPAQWNLTAFRQRVQDLADHGPTPLQRGQAQLLLEKIDQFDTLRRRQVQVENSIAVREGRKSPASSVEPRYDGAGWLMPVQHNRRGAPAFALTDDDGHPLQFVVPAPGVNLNRYLQKRVGIYGQRSQKKSANATPIITAQRVVDLEHSTLR